MLKHCKTEEIKTDRLVLKKFNVDYAEDMFYGWLCDEKVAKYTSWTAHTDISNTYAYINYIIGQEGDNPYNWVIVYNKKVIGTINVCYIDKDTKTCGVAYALSYNYWRNGIVTEALKAVINYLFDKAGFQKIIAGCDSENTGSKRVLEKAGMKQEACLKKQIKRKDGSYGGSLQFVLWKDTYQ